MPKPSGKEKLHYVSMELSAAGDVHATLKKARCTRPSNAMQATEVCTQSPEHAKKGVQKSDIAPPKGLPGQCA